jgi:tRNA A58 N-methylase Trm61
MKICEVIEETAVVVEVGTGSGVVLAFTAAQSQQIFGRRDILTLGIDDDNVSKKRYESSDGS